MISLRSVLLIALGIGIVLPYAAFVPWVMDHGLDVPRFVAEIFATRIGAFFAADVVVSALVLIGMAMYEQRRTGLGAGPVIAATLLIGVSAGLPLYLYRRLGRAS